MPGSHWSWPTINEDVDAEFHFWKEQLVVSAGLAIALAVLVGLAIALWPATANNTVSLAFAREFWVLIAECAFWLGFLIGLLRAGLWRIGAALIGRLPWQ